MTKGRPKRALTEVADAQRRRNGDSIISSKIGALSND
jgi:hypothetical protein